MLALGLTFCGESKKQDEPDQQEVEFQAPAEEISEAVAEEEAKEDDEEAVAKEKTEPATSTTDTEYEAAQRSEKSATSGKTPGPARQKKCLA